MFSLFTSKSTPLCDTQVLNKNFSKNIAFESTAGLIFINIKIDGKPYKLLLDTAAHTLFSSHLATQLQAIKTEKTLCTIDAFGSEKDMRIYTLPSLNISGVVFKNFSIIQDDFSHNFPLSCLEFDGILGYNFFENLSLELNYDTQHITLSDKAFTQNGFISSKLTTINGGVPLLDLQLECHKIQIAIDTGKNDGILLGEKAFFQYAAEKKLQTQRTTGLFSSSFSGLNQHSFIDTYLVKKFKVNKKITINSFLISYQENAQNIAGNDFLKNFHIIIDFRRKKLYLKKRALEIEETFIKSFGFLTFWEEQKKLYISAIIENSPAYRSKLKIGDRILAIDELETLNFTQKDYCHFSLLAQKRLFYNVNSITLTIKRGSKLIRTELRL